MLNYVDSAHEIDSRRAVNALVPALLVSLTLHAALGGLFFHTSQRVPVELPKPLKVTMVEVEPLRPAAVLPPTPARRAPPERSPSQPATVVQPATALTPLAVERTAAVPVASVPVVETPAAPPAPTKVAVVPVVPARAEGMEPPHFNVAYLNNPRPAYPQMARRLGIEGLVVLRVQVSAKGLPEQVVVAQTSGQTVLDEAALRAVQGWSFVPARLGDKPIAHAVDVPVRFQLKN
jgi:periplasmic protein TonB